MSAIASPIVQPAGGLAPPNGARCNGLLDLRRVRHLHDFCRGVSFLRGEKSLRTDASRSALRRSDLLHGFVWCPSSLTIHLASRFSRARPSAAHFSACGSYDCPRWALYVRQAQEWHRLIYEHGLTISTTFLGTTYYSLVGLHAFHVTAGLLMLSIVLLLGLAGPRRREQSVRVAVLSLYGFCGCRMGRWFSQ